MSDFFQIFQPGLRHQQEQRDLEKILVVDEDAGGTGPKTHNLESGEVTIRMPKRAPAPKPVSKQPRATKPDKPSKSEDQEQDD